MKKLSKFIYFIFAFALIACMSIFNPAIDFVSADGSAQEGSKSITISNSKIIDTIEADTEEGLKIPMPKVENASANAKTYIAVTDRSGVKYLYDCKEGATLDAKKNPLTNVNYFTKYDDTDAITDVADDVEYIKVTKHGKGTYKVQYIVEDGNKTYCSEVKTVKVNSVAYSWNFDSKGEVKNIIPATTKAETTHILPLPTIDNSLDNTSIKYTKEDVGTKIIVTNSGHDVTADVLDFDDSVSTDEDYDPNVYFTPTLASGEVSDTYIIKYIAKDTANAFPDKTFTVKVTDDYKTDAELEVTHNAITNYQQGAKITFPTANVTDKTHNKSNVETSVEIMIKKAGVEVAVLKNQYDYTFPVTDNSSDTYVIQYKVTDAFGNVAVSKATSITVNDKKPHMIAFADNYRVITDGTTGEITFEDLNTKAEYLIANEVGYNGFYVPAIYAEDYVASYDELEFSRKLVATDGSGLEFDIDDEDDNAAFAENQAAGLSYNNVVKFKFTPKTGKKDGVDYEYQLSDYAGMSFQLVYSVKDGNSSNTAREATKYTIKVAKVDALTNNVDKNLIINFPTINDEIDPSATLTFATATAKEDPTDKNLIADERVQVRTFYYYGDGTTISKKTIEKELADYITEISAGNDEYIKKYGYDFETFLNSVKATYGIEELYSVDGKTDIKLTAYAQQAQVTIFAVAINDQGQFIIKAQDVAIKNTSDNTIPVIGTPGNIYTLNEVANNAKFSQNAEIKIPGLTFTDNDKSLQVDIRCYVDTPDQTVGISIEKFVEGCGINSAKLTTTYAGTYYIVYTATDDGGNQASYMSTFEVAKTEKAYINVENGANITKNVGEEVVLNVNLAGNGEYDDEEIYITWGDNKPSGLGSTPNSYKFDKAGTYVATITAYYTMNDGAIEVEDTPSVTVTITVKEPTMEWASDIDEILVDRTANLREPIILDVISANENGEYVPAVPTVVFIDSNDKEIPVELTFNHDKNHWEFEANQDGVYKVTYTATTEYNSKSKTFNITCGDYYEPTINFANNKLENSKVVYEGQDITLTAELKKQTSEDEDEDMTGKYILTVIAKNADGKQVFNYDINVDLKDTDAEEITELFTPASWSFALSGDHASSKTVSNNVSKWTISGVGSYELSLTVKDANGNSTTKAIKFDVTSKTEPKSIKDSVVGIVLIVISVVVLGGVILFFALAGKRNKTKRTAVKAKKD